MKAVKTSFYFLLTIVAVMNAQKASSEAYAFLQSVAVIHSFVHSFTTCRLEAACSAAVKVTTQFDRASWFKFMSVGIANILQRLYTEDHKPQVRYRDRSVGQFEWP